MKYINQYLKLRNQDEINDNNQYINILIQSKEFIQKQGLDD